MKLFLFLIAIIAGLAGATPSLALQIADYPVFLNIREGMPLTAIISLVFNVFLMAGGLAGLVVIVFGGVKYLTSAGAPAKTKDAKSQIFGAILGLIILFSSWLVLSSINPDLVDIKEPFTAPVPVINPPSVPIGPVAPTPAAFFYIPLGKIIDDVVSQERETIPKMQNFANSATECNRDQCSGGTCEYWVSVPCPPVEGEGTTGTGTEGDGTGDGGFNWNNWLGTFKIPSVYAEGDCGYWATCSAPCNTGDPCPANRSAVISEVLASADKMGEEITKLQQAKSKIGKCVLQEDTILLSCHEVLDIFRPESGEAPPAQWDEVQDCRQGYDFYCLYGMDETGYLDEIILPFDTIKEGIAKTRELENVVSSCNCSNCSFVCEGCSGACSGTPCPAQTYGFLSDAIGAVNELETRLKKLEDTISEIIGLSMADEVSTLTCSEAYSWLKLIKESGCPGVKTFPCCPVDQEIEKTIRSCQGTDFFFCSAP